MSSALFKNVTYKLFAYKSLYDKQDLVSNNSIGLIYHKTLPNSFKVSSEIFLNNCGPTIVYAPFDYLAIKD